MKSPHPIDIHVGARVRMRRLMLGMSQDRLAETLGLTFQQIQKYEKGVNRIGASRLFQLSEALAVDVQFFYSDLPRSAPTSEKNEPLADTAPLAETLSTHEGVQLCRHFSGIKDRQVKKKILDLVKTLSEHGTLTKTVGDSTPSIWLD